MTDATATRKPAADRLAELRDRIRALRDQEQQLRRGLISGDLPRDGDDFVVVIETKTNARLDLDRMRRHVAETIWRPYVVETSVTHVNVRRKQ
jgi:hypothetical protein